MASRRKLRPTSFIENVYEQKKELFWKSYLREYDQQEDPRAKLAEFFGRERLNELNENFSNLMGAVLTPETFRFDTVENRVNARYFLIKVEELAEAAFLLKGQPYPKSNKSRFKTNVRRKDIPDPF
jgi:hypothetical protein